MSTSWPRIGPTALASRRVATAPGPEFRRRPFRPPDSRISSTRAQYRVDDVPLPAVPAPDSRGLAFIDHTQRIHVFDRETEASTEIDRGPHMLQ